jgi:hypothetical protein
MAERKRGAAGERRANRAALQAMDKSFPEWPALFFDFVLPSRSKDLFSNFWIADPHGTTPTFERLRKFRKDSGLARGIRGTSRGNLRFVRDVARWKHKKGVANRPFRASTPVCGVEAMEAGTNAISRTSQTGCGQRPGGANRRESPRPVAHRNSPALAIALPNAYFAQLGLPPMVVRSA